MMTRSTVFEHVKHAVSDRLNLDGATVNNITRLTDIIKDLEADDLDRAELIMDFEDAFGIQIPEEDVIEKIEVPNFSVGNCVDYICKKLNIL